MSISNLTNAKLELTGGCRAREAALTTKERYSHLAPESIFVRASDSERVVESAQIWASSFSSQKPEVLVVSEERGSNNTLDNVSLVCSS